MSKNINLEKINEGSMTEVKFLTDINVYNNIRKNSNSVFTYLFAREGLYLIQNSELMFTWRLIQNINYKNIYLEHFPGYSEGTNYSGFKSNVSRAPKKHLEYIIEAFKYVQKLTKEEFFILLYWNKEDRDFEIVIPKEQAISGANVTYRYPDHEFDPNYVRYLEIHSHHSMAPKFSGGSGDDKDESHKVSSFFGVIGHLSENTNINNVSASFRIWNGYDFTYLSKEDVFNIPKPKQQELPNWIVEGIDEIMEYSRQYKRKNNNYYYDRQGFGYTFSPSTGEVKKDVPRSLLLDEGDVRYGLEEIDYYNQDEDIIDIMDEDEQEFNFFSFEENDRHHNSRNT